MFTDTPSIQPPTMQLGKTFQPESHRLHRSHRHELHRHRAHDSRTANSRRPGYARSRRRSWRSSRLIRRMNDWRLSAQCDYFFVSLKRAIILISQSDLHVLSPFPWLRTHSAEAEYLTPRSILRLAWRWRPSGVKHAFFHDRSIEYFEQSVPLLCRFVCIPSNGPEVCQH